MEQASIMPILKDKEQNMKEKIIEAVQEVNMMDKAESDIAAFYKETLEQLTEQEIEVTVEVISDGKYGVQISFNGRLFWMISKDWDTVRKIVINVVAAINELKLI